MKSIYLLSVLFLGAFSLAAQNEARLFRMPDVSATQIVFVYGDDVWLAPKQGGTAIKLSSPAGSESFPRFSPDGQTVAYSANYDGNVDIYTIPASGGTPFRVTHHGMLDLMQDWLPDGKNLMFSSTMNSGKQRFSQFYKVPVTGGLPEKLPPALGEFACFSPDGTKMAFVLKSQAFRTWKRYRGGTAADIFTFDLKTFSSENITKNDANDEFPMWHRDEIYYISDAGPEKRYNLWVYNLKTKSRKQITNFREFDVIFPSIGPEEIAFTAGGVLYLLKLSDQTYRSVPIRITDDFTDVKPRIINVKDRVHFVSPSPDGNRLLVEARGEVFSVPAQKGYSVNLSQNSGSAERYPAWSPDGRFAAWWSDKKGEYQLVIRDLAKPNGEETVTQFTSGFRYRIFWSPDSKKLAFVDQSMKIQVFDRDTKAVQIVDQAPDLFEGALQYFRVSWSADSRWMAYDKTQTNGNQAIYLYDFKEKQSRKITSGFYPDYNPVFDPNGKYLYFVTNRSFSPIYSEFENSFIYNKSALLGVITLQKDSLSPLFVENDTVAIKIDLPEKKDDQDKTKEGKKDDKGEKDKPVVIDFDGLELRMETLPLPAGNYQNLSVSGKKILYLTPMPQPPANGPALMLKYFDFSSREEKNIAEGIDGYVLSANGEKVLLVKGDEMTVVKPEPDQKFEKLVPLSGLEMMLDPRAEWKQLFNDAWRFERDYFYEAEMHGVDWPAMRKRYGDLLPFAASRSDVNFLIGELIGELNASHTYRGGGDLEVPKQRATGYLGVDWASENGFYRIKKIIRGADWDIEARSPLDAPGVRIKEGDYVLAVNGRPITVDTDPWAAFEGLAETAVELTINAKPTWEGARRVIVRTLRDETRLRNLAWIEENRQLTDKLSGGKIGYVYVPSTGFDGQNELARMFYAQWDKPGLVIDERFNNGGQIPDRFIELLNRKPLAFWAVRDGRTWQWPPVGHFGPKAMLINGWSGSGGDAFPDYFRKAGLGPLVGTRTWGGLIGISGAPQLIDGGVVTVPTFRMYNPDGSWFREGHGVDPDIEVLEDPEQQAKGKDPQLERAIQEVLNKLQNNKPAVPNRPAPEKRN